MKVVKCSCFVRHVYTHLYRMTSLFIESLLRRRIVFMITIFNNLSFAPQQRDITATVMTSTKLTIQNCMYYFVALPCWLVALPCWILLLCLAVFPQRVIPFFSDIILKCHFLLCLIVALRITPGLRYSFFPSLTMYDWDEVLLVIAVAVIGPLTESQCEEACFDHLHHLHLYLVVMCDFSIVIKHRPCLVGVVQCVML